MVGVEVYDGGKNDDVDKSKYDNDQPCYEEVEVIDQGFFFAGGRQHDVVDWGLRVGEFVLQHSGRPYEYNEEGYSLEEIEWAYDCGVDHEEFDTFEEIALQGEQYE